MQGKQCFDNLVSTHLCFRKCAAAFNSVMFRLGVFPRLSNVPLTQVARCRNITRHDFVQQINSLDMFNSGCIRDACQILLDIVLSIPNYVWGTYERIRLCKIFVEIAARWDSLLLYTHFHDKHTHCSVHK